MAVSVAGPRSIINIGYYTDPTGKRHTVEISREAYEFLKDLWARTGGDSDQIAASGEYNQGGSGAVTRSVSSRLSDRVSVKDFGAVGNGTTDDTTACQNALDYMLSSGRRGNLFFPPGDYLISDTLTVEGLSIGVEGEASELSSVITAAHLSGPVFRMKDRNAVCRFLNITSTSARQAAALSDNHGILIEADDVAGQAADRGLYDNLYIQKQPGHGIVVIGASYHCSFKRSIIRDCGGHGLVYDDGTLTTRTNKELPGISTVEELEIFDNDGHGVIIGNDDNGVSNRGLRVIINNCDIFRNAEAAGPRKSADQIWMFGDLCAIRDTALGGHDKDQTAATTRGALVAGRSNRFENNRYLNVTPQALRFQTISSWPTEGCVVEEMFVVGSNQPDLSPAVLIDSDVDSVRVWSRNTFKVDRLVTDNSSGRDRTVEVRQKTTLESVTNSAVLQNDDQLFAALLPEERAGFACHLWVNGPAAGDIQISFSVPAGASLRWGPTGGMKVDSAGSVVVQDSVTSGSIVFGADTSPRLISLVGEVLNGGTAGNLQLQWAQSLADPTPTNIRAQSRLEVYRG